MSDLIDQPARERFCREWDRNFAVSANAGSGKTTAISRRLAAMALSPEGAAALRRTAVVTYTRKAAGQIGQKARQALLRQLRESGTVDLAPLDHLEHAFFGTIHSFCLMLAQTYGQAAGINLNPTLVTDDDDALWEAFLEDDAMEFRSLVPSELTAFLRHVPLAEIFPLARDLDRAAADRLAARAPGPPARPAQAALDQLLTLPAKGTGARNVLASQAAARAWQEAYEGGSGFLPLYAPSGSGAALTESASAWMAPLKTWLAAAAAVLAAELARRYRAWRFERGVQTYADQIDAALAVLEHDVLLDRIRAEGWRIILDEAQDTDPQQFAVLVEIARPPGAARGAWPSPAGRARVPGPRPGHFSLVGDGQQAIYGSRADIGNFLRHVEAFRHGDAGELLEFQVTFRAPKAVIAGLNATLPAAFGPDRPHNLGVAPSPGAPEPRLQVPYVPLEPGPTNPDGAFVRFPLVDPAERPPGVEGWLEEEARQLARWLRSQGPEAIGARDWGEVAVLAPRNDWLVVVRRVFEDQGLKVALQTKRLRNGDNPVYAWMTGLLAVCADPENGFEWYGVLREVFGVSDALLAAELKRLGHFAWEEPGAHPEPLATALARVRPFVLGFNDEGKSLADFASALAAACGLAERARILDPAGTLSEDLQRLLATAAEQGLEGVSPRAWLQELLAALDDGRAAGKPESDAVNLLTVHSAKGLEWPVVILAGWWRGIGKAPERGMRLVRGREGGVDAVRVYFDQSSLPAETVEARERERMRELVRLMYVAMTRAMRVLVVPWAAGFGNPKRQKASFAELWGEDLSVRPDLEGGIPPPPEPAVTLSEPVADFWPESLSQPQPAPVLPARRLPHQLAQGADRIRAVRHDTVDEVLPLPGGEEAIDYGLWWHETLEFVPWEADDPLVERYAVQALVRAEMSGFADRGRREWTALRESQAWRAMRNPRWTRLSELAVFAPLDDEAWVDGVVDLVLYDPGAAEVWIVDWKTNRRRPDEDPDRFLARLRDEYAAQLKAYVRSLAPFFPGHRVRAWIYATALGDWGEIAPE